MLSAPLVLTVIVWRSEGVFWDRPTRRKYHEIADGDTRANWLTRQNREYRRILETFQHQQSTVLGHWHGKW